MRRTLFALMAFALGVSLVLAAVEIGMRAVGIGYPIFFVPHPVAGARMWPNLTAWYGLEGGALVETNAVGFRDFDHPRAKPAGEFRFALLGDSYTEAMQVPFEATYWNVARRALTQCPWLGDREPVPMNFGLSGIGTAQELEILRHFVWDYDPDLVVLAFVSNDLTDNHPAYGGLGLKPFYLFDAAGDLVLEADFRTSPAFLERLSPGRNLRRQVLQRSRVLQWMLEIYNSRLRKASLEEGSARRGQLSRPPEDGSLREAWVITEALIEKVAGDVESHGSEFLLFSVTTGHQVHPDPKHREARVAENAGDDSAYWNKRLAASAAGEGIAYLDLVERFVAHAESNQTCLHGFENSLPCGGHWNAEGHRLAGEALAEAICLQLAESGREKMN